MWLKEEMAGIWGQIKSSKLTSRIKQICYHAECEQVKLKTVQLKEGDGA